MTNHKMFFCNLTQIMPRHSLPELILGGLGLLIIIKVKWTGIRTYDHGRVLDF